MMLLSCIALLVMLIVASVFDLRERRIPNGVVIATAAIWVVMHILAVSLMVLSGEPVGGYILAAALRLVAAVLFGASLLVITVLFEYALGKHAMGGGDIKLMSVVILYTGVYRGLICMLVACCVAIVLRFIIPKTRFAKEEGNSIPFAPAIAIGALVAVII